VRILSFDLYWRLLALVTDLDPDVYLASRLLLHLAGGAVLGLIVRQLGGRAAGVGLAAALYLLSPLAFEALYWAAGVTELLANLGLLLAVLGALRGRRSGVALLIVGGLVCLTSKETGWWLPILAVVAWRRHRQRAYLDAGVVLLVVAAISLWCTARGLAHDYAWTPAAVPWNLLRSGSWLLPRAWDLTRVWDAGLLTLAAGGVVWLAWLAWAALRLRRRDPLPALALGCGLLSLAPVVGLEGHMVPRYLLPVQASLAASLALVLPARNRWPDLLVAAAAVALAFYTSWCVDQFLDRTFAKGRPCHRLVAKEMMVRIAWRKLATSGVDAGTGIAFLERPEDDVKGREYILDVIGREWGPRLLLGPQTPVMITDRPTDIPPLTLTFGFGSWSLEYLGVRRQ
jgi:hypothetical protein